MTSKNLFFKLIWQDFKKRIWCPILIFIVYLLSMEVPLLNQFDLMKRYPTEFTYSMKHYLANDFCIFPVARRNFLTVPHIRPPNTGCTNP